MSRKVDIAQLFELRDAEDGWVRVAPCGAVAAHQPRHHSLFDATPIYDCNFHLMVCEEWACVQALEEYGRRIA